jgi:hypothetical protein
MKRLFVSFMLLASIASCKKEETPVVEKTYSVQYKIELTPSPNTTLSGTASYISKTSASTSAVLASPGWTFTETNWVLKKGDKIGFTATVANVGSYKASIVVDGGVRALDNLSQSLPYNGTIQLSYTVE